MHAAEVAPGHLEVAVQARADGQHHRVVADAEFGDDQVAADVDAVLEGDPLLGKQRHPPVDDPFLELRVGHAEAQQPAGGLVALVDRDLVAALVQLGGHRQARGAGAHHAAVRPVRTSGGSGVIQPSSKPRVTIASSICSIVTGSSLMSSTQADSQGAGQISP